MRILPILLTVYHGRRADFAPLYDLVSTSVYPELSQEMAMRIGGDAAFDSISRDSFSRMAEECAVAPKLVLGRLDYIAKRIVPAASRNQDAAFAAATLHSGRVCGGTVLDAPMVAAKAYQPPQIYRGLPYLGVYNANFCVNLPNSSKNLGFFLYEAKADK